MMNDKTSAARDRLVAETFHEDWDAGPATIFAYRAARLARRYRAVRRAGLVTGIFIAVITGLFALRMSSSSPAVRPEVVRRDQNAHQSSRGYEILSDDEFLARVTGQPLLILSDGRGGKQITLLPE